MGTYANSASTPRRSSSLIHLRLAAMIRSSIDEASPPPPAATAPIFQPAQIASVNDFGQMWVGFQAESQESVTLAGASEHRREQGHAGRLDEHLDELR